MTSIALRTEHDLLGAKEVPADAYYGVQTARALENFAISGVELRLYPDLIQALAMVKLAAARANFDCGQLAGGDPGGHRGRLPRADRGQAPRRVPARRPPGRRRHLDQHERQRGDRQPRARADGSREGRVPVLRPPRPRQLLAVDQRRLSDRAPRRARARQRAAPGRGRRADRRVPRQGAGVRADLEDGAHPAPGRGADDARPGVRGVRRDARGRGPRARPRAADRAVRDQHGRDRDRHRLERAAGLRAEVHRRTWPRSPASRSSSPRT